MSCVRTSTNLCEYSAVLEYKHKFFRFSVLLILVSCSLSEVRVSGKVSFVVQRMAAFVFAAP